MSRNWGHSRQTGKLNPQNPVVAGGWTVTWGPEDLPRSPAEAYHAVVEGPAASTFKIFIDQTFYGHVARGDINEWDPTQPMYIQPGSYIYWHYDTAAGPAPKGTMFFRAASQLF